MTVTIDAVYVNGILKPLTPLNLPDNQQVTIQVITPRPLVVTKPDPTEVTFRGIWPLAVADDLEQTLAEIRAESNRKLDRLADELEEALAAKA
jgi:predicted DNA-binding antitoxin AbrB/MazE fold protein